MRQGIRVSNAKRAEMVALYLKGTHTYEQLAEMFQVAPTTVGRFVRQHHLREAANSKV